MLEGVANTTAPSVTREAIRLKRKGDTPCESCRVYMLKMSQSIIEGSVKYATKLRAFPECHKNALCRTRGRAAHDVGCRVICGGRAKVLEPAIVTITSPY